MKKYSIVIGIDPGVNTGYAVWNKPGRRLTTVKSYPIHEAMTRVKMLHQMYPGEVLVRFEDARQRKWFGNADREKLQGAGSVKRDCSIWEDYLKSLGIDFQMVAPKNNRTKLNSDAFNSFTKWETLTNEHGRDAAMLVYQF